MKARLRNKECLFIKVSFLLKMVVSVIIRRSLDRQFHSAGPEKEKAQKV